MHDRRAIDALIERLVDDANLRGQRAGDDLRRELVSHFEESGGSPESMRAALDRFGSVEAVGGGLRRAHRRGRLALYVGKVIASILAASGAALTLQAIVNLRIGAGADTMRLGSGYFISACFSLAIILLLVAAWELDIEPLCARLERRPLRLIAAFLALFTGIYLGHPMLHGPLEPRLVLVASAAGVIVWTLTVAILARLDLAFLRLLGPRA